MNIMSNYQLNPRCFFSVSFLLLIVWLIFLPVSAKAEGVLRSDLDNHTYDPSETKAMIKEIDFTTSGKASDLRDGVATLEGITIKDGQNQAEWLSPAIEVPFKNVNPFLALAPMWMADGDYPGQAEIDFRFSRDGSEWSDWLHLHLEHVSRDNGQHYGDLAFAEKETRFVQYRFRILRDEERGAPVISRVGLYFIHPGVSDEALKQEMLNKSWENRNKKRIKKENDVLERGTQTADLSLPSYVPRTSWGAPLGLSNTAGRSITTVTHIVVHHSGSNTVSSDFPAVVRSYYNWHVGGRGWADIGYNWLVDGNGVIYQGRAFHTSGNRDVVGAHAAPYNTGTMGICAIGNYQSSGPVSALRSSMEEMIAWKANERNINPEGRPHHASTNTTRPAIMGHRDASSTGCPGDFLYGQLPSIRSNVKSMLDGGTPPPGTGVLRGVIYHGNDIQNLSNRISGATVRLNTGKQMTSGDDGSYLFELEPGTYTVTASKSGFESNSLTRDVVASETAWGSIQLSAGSSSDPDPSMITDLPWSEDFSGVKPEDNHGTELPEGWQKIGNVETSVWGGTNNNTTNLRFPSPTEGPIAIMPEISTDINISNLKLRFKAHYATAGDSGDKIHVGFISNPSDAGSFRQIETLSLTDAFSEYSVNLTNHTSGDGRRIAFKAERGGSWNAHYLGKIELENGEAISAETTPERPQALELKQNYPNPFNPITVLSYALPTESHVQLSIYDVTGRQIALLVDEAQSPGRHDVQWDASGFSSGVYIYRLEANGETRTRRMTLVK